MLWMLADALLADALLADALDATLSMLVLWGPRRTRLRQPRRMRQEAK